MRSPGASRKAADPPLHSHPAFARWMAEARRQQRRSSRRSRDAMARLATPDLAPARPPRA